MLEKIMKRLLFFLLIMEAHSTAIADTPLNFVYFVPEFFLRSANLLPYDQLTPSQTDTVIPDNSFPEHHQFVLSFPAKSRTKTISIQFNQPFIAFPGGPENEDPLVLEVDRQNNQLIVEAPERDSMDEDTHPVKKTLWIASSGDVTGIKTHDHSSEQPMKPSKLLSNSGDLTVKEVRHLFTEKEMAVLHSPPEGSHWGKEGPEGQIPPSLRNLIVYMLPGKESNEEEIKKKTARQLSDQPPLPDQPPPPPLNGHSTENSGEPSHQPYSAEVAQADDFQLNHKVAENTKNQATQTSGAPTQSQLAQTRFSHTSESDISQRPGFNEFIQLLLRELAKPLTLDQQPTRDTSPDPLMNKERVFKKTVEQPNIRRSLQAVNAFFLTRTLPGTTDQQPAAPLLTESNSSHHQAPPPSLDKPANESETQAKPKSQKKNKSSTCHIL